MKITNILVTHSFFPDKLLSSIDQSVHAPDWLVFFHGHNKDLQDEIAAAVAQRSGRYFPYAVDRGLAKSWNEAIKIAIAEGSDLILLLNDDLFFYEGCYDKFVSFCADTMRTRPDVGVVFTNGLESGGSPYAGKVQQQGFACCCVLPSAIAAIGYFDENFQPAYFEDIDYSRRLHLVGLGLTICDETLIEHERSLTTRLDPELAASNQKIFDACRSHYVAKWGGAPGTELYATPFDRPDLGPVISAEDCERPYAPKAKPSTPHILPASAVAGVDDGAASVDDAIVFPVGGRRKNSTVVIYHYYEANDLYRENLKFFLDVAINPLADYIIILAAGCTVDLPVYDNVTYLHTKNEGLDFGGYRLALRACDVKDYAYLIFLNCTAIGPFVPAYHAGAWCDVFTSMLDDKVKLVGTSINVLHGPGLADMYAEVFGGAAPFPHVISMCFALDQECLRYLVSHDLFEAPTSDKHDVIIRKEIRMSQLVLLKGWQIGCVLPEFFGMDFRRLDADPNPSSRSGDPWFERGYFGRTLHPLETVFHKNSRALLSADDYDGLKQSQRLQKKARRSQLDGVLYRYPSAWIGHKNFARWLVNRVRPRTIVDLGVDFAFSTFCFASAGGDRVVGIDSFEGDHQAGIRDTQAIVTAASKELNFQNLRFLKGYFSDVAASWSEPIDILHIDGLPEYEAVASDYATWSKFLSDDAVVLLHDTCVPHFGVRQLFNEIDRPKINFTNSFGLGVVSNNRAILAEIKSVFATQIEVNP